MNDEKGRAPAGGYSFQAQPAQGGLDEKAKSYLYNFKEKEYGIVAYRLGNTLTPNGSAKRGVCEVDENNNLIQLTESKVILKNDEAEVEPLDGSPIFLTSKNTIACMNFLLFDLSIFDLIEKKLDIFLEENKNDLNTCEFLIPEVLNDYVKKEKGKVYIIETSAVWYGVTYKEDKEMVVEALKKLTDENIYPQNLWKL